jgi:iron complex transport system substrate-binding protein
MKPDLCRRAIGPALLLSLLLPTAARAAATLKVEHASGSTEVPLRPQRVLVYDLGVLDTLDALGVPVVGVPKWDMPPGLQRYEGPAYAKIGSLFVPDEEAVHAARPDLILIGARTREKYERLARLAPTLDLSTDPKDFYASVMRNARLLGRIFAKEAEVAQRLQRLETSMAQLRQRAATAGSALILLTTGGKISAYGPGSRFGLLHDAFGLRPADPGLRPATHGQAVSYEYILKTDPDWLFVVDRDAAIGAPGRSAAQLLDNPLVARTKAWRQQRVVYLDPAQLYLTSAGLRAEQQIVDAVAQALARA